MLLEVKHRVARRVASGVHRARRAGDVEGLAVAECPHLADRLRLARRVEVREELPRVRMAKVREGGRLALAEPLAALGEIDVVAVHPDRHAELAPHLLREARVVRMRVRQHDRLDVPGAAADRAERALELRAVHREPAVDDRDAAAVVHEEPVDEIGPRLDHAVGDLLRLEFPPEHGSVVTVRRVGVSR